jgi:parallel beta-helix repeat protein
MKTARATSASFTASLTLGLVTILSLPAPAASTSYSCLRNLYISTVGSDAHSGLSADEAFKTITHGASVAHAGDCVMVMPGTYQEHVIVSNGGNEDTPTGYVVIASQVRHAAKIISYGSTYSTFVLGNGANYVIIDGFDVKGDRTNGGTGGGHAIDAGQGTHHNKFLNNIAHDSGGSGISVAYGDYYTIEGNLSYNNASTSKFQTSGISVFQARAISNASPGFHIVVSGNASYLNQEYDIVGGAAHTDGNGIIIDDFHNSQGKSTAGNYPYLTLVENNVVYGNGGRGIAVYLSDNVTIRNNTAYFNNRDKLNPGTWRGELNNQEGSDNSWVNNIAFTDQSANLNNTAIGDESCCGYNESGTLWKNNLTFNGTVGVASVLIRGLPSSITIENGNLLGVDPRFAHPSIDPESADFHLRSTSPAIGKGTSSVGLSTTDFDGISRQSGSTDLGAYVHR